MLEPLIGALDPAWAHPFPTLGLITSSWSFEIGHGGSIDIMETVQLILSVLNISTLSSTSFLVHLCYNLFYI